MDSAASLPRRALQHSMVRFAGVGAVSTTADILVYRGLYPLLISNVYVATALGFVTGLTIGFFLNGRYVFKQDRTTRRYLKYGLISVGGLLITEFIIHLFYKDWELMGPLGAKLLAVAIVFFWNYTWSKFWAFK